MVKLTALIKIVAVLAVFKFSNIDLYVCKKNIKFVKGFNLYL